MSNETTRRVAANLRAEVARQGLTQAAVAERVGIAQQGVSRRLSGRYAITVDDLEDFCTALDIAVAQAMGLDEALGRAA